MLYIGGEGGDTYMTESILQTAAAAEYGEMLSISDGRPHTVHSRAIDDGNELR